MELRTTHKELPHPDRVIVHRKGVPGNEEEEHLAHELRCYPNTAQVRKSCLPWLVHRSFLIGQRMCNRYGGPRWSREGLHKKHPGLVQDASQRLRLRCRRSR